MIDLYAAGTSNGMRARIALEECGLEYTFHPIDLAKGDNKTREYLALNPNGQIPVIVDHDGLHPVGQGKGAYLGGHQRPRTGNRRSQQAKSTHRFLPSIHLDKG